MIVILYLEISSIWENSLEVFFYLLEMCSKHLHLASWIWAHFIETALLSHSEGSDFKRKMVQWVCLAHAWPPASPRQKQLVFVSFLSIFPGMSFTPTSKYMQSHFFLRMENTNMRAQKLFIHLTNIYWISAVCQALFQVCGFHQFTKPNILMGRGRQWTSSRIIR